MMRTLIPDGAVRPLTEKRCRMGIFDKLTGKEAKAKAEAEAAELKAKAELRQKKQQLN